MSCKAIVSYTSCWIDDKGKSRENNSLWKKDPVMSIFIQICLSKRAFTIFSIKYCHIFRFETPSYSLHSISADLFSFFSFCLILPVFLSPILISHMSFVLSRTAAHWVHFNLPYIPPLFPLSPFMPSLLPWSFASCARSPNSGTLLILFSNSYQTQWVAALTSPL